MFFKHISKKILTFPIRFSTTRLYPFLAHTIKNRKKYNFISKIYVIKFPPLLVIAICQQTHRIWKNFKIHILSGLLLLYLTLSEENLLKNIFVIRKRQNFLLPRLLSGKTHIYIFETNKQTYLGLKMV